MGLGTLKELHEFANNVTYETLADYVLAKFASLDMQRRRTGKIQQVG